MFNPVSTYRIQFHKEFTFRQLEEIIPYLQELGIRTLYASPVLEAAPGSMHGYDTINPHRINPEIGTLEELRSVSSRLRQAGISWIQDIVPNHMAFHPGNTMLMDVLEKGRETAFPGFFDINWSGDQDEPLMVPFLGSSLAEAIDKKEISLVRAPDGALKFQYMDTQWPVNKRVKDINMPVAEAMELQYYRLCYWKDTNLKINYRRFFTVNNLICLNMQEEKTFDIYHQLIRTLLEEQVFQGLRVDHIDGLYDPETYLKRLRKLAGEQTYIVIEKILEEAEQLPSQWPVQGTTGYDFLAQANNLFTRSAAKAKLTHFYEALTGDDKEIPKQIRQKKAGILSEFMAGELDNLYQLFCSLELATEQELKELKPGTLKDAIGQLLICCPVYRYYGSTLPLRDKDLEGLQTILEEVAVVKPLRPAVELLRKVLLVQPAQGSAEDHTKATLFYLRCMQFSGPLMAKGVEDTLMYTYNRFIGHNEVGDAPSAFGSPPEEVHRQMQQRQEHWSLSINGTSTHDTKRGEEVRARLNVLTDLPAEWIHRVKKWKIINAGRSEGIDPNDEYFIYQTLAGSTPMPGMSLADYQQRVSDYLIKALREAKVNSDWAEPDQGYESLVTSFLASLLDQAGDFWNDFSHFQAGIADAGIVNALGQILLKYTAPGVPDIYQGTELWDLSLVDPDNRRPVDYEQRSAWLKEIKTAGATLKELWQERYSGKIKLALHHRLLEMRNLHAELFAAGRYVPLAVKGKYAAHIFAFARRKDTKWIVTVLPLHVQRITSKKMPVLSLDWKDTRVRMPHGLPENWLNLLDGQPGKLNGRDLSVQEIFREFPLGLIEMEQAGEERSAGILLHVTSLPSPYGVGDLGSGARNFLDFLSGAGQTYWQLLPLNPVAADQAFSPYSAISGFAGNTLLISPDRLAERGLLTAQELREITLPAAAQVDFAAAIPLKAQALHKAYLRFRQSAPPADQSDFAAFCTQESAWLEDYALYSVLRQHHQQAPWFDWEPGYRDRQPAQLDTFSAAHEEELTEVKWGQFIFFRQWGELRAYAALLSIRLYGDLPFYLGHDAAEVWANRQYFSLDEQGKMTGVAGVPPDYFNAEGQLWGMPVYNWDKLKADGYRWWLSRLQRNMELYDLLRLDHFRAFADYWEVPAAARTAIGGSWKTGPGSDFFEVVRKAFPELPFIAEDLGEVSPDIFQLRDQFGLPGMKVLQFAFGEDSARSEHVPHRFASDQFAVYTGTHDNNTSAGWYEEEASPADQQRLAKYAGRKVSDKNVHKVLSRLAYASVARIAILPMQDVLGLSGKARMNRPASINGNWTWRLRSFPGKKTSGRLQGLARIYGR